MNGYYDAAVAAGLDPSLAAYMPRYVQIESGGDPNARTGSYSGLLQMGPDEIKRYGGNGYAMYADRAKSFQTKYGRAPSPTELYLTNQQGEGGLAAHLGNPDTPAWQNMFSTAEGQKKGAGWAKQAIWGNVPDDLKAQFPGGVDSLTSKQFMDLWQHKVERTPMASAFADTRKSNMDPMQEAMAARQPNQYAYAPNYDPNAGLFDRLRAGGPGALFGAPNGVFPGANGQAGYDLGNRLQRAGAWAMGQPGVASALANQNHRKFVQIGTDEFGNPSYGFVDEQRGTVTRANGAGMGGAGGAGEMNTSGISQAINEGLSGDELLNDPRIPAVVRANARSYLEGSRPYPLAPRDGLGKMSVAVANAAAPGEDLTGRQKAVRDWTGNGQSAILQGRVNQLASHLEGLTKSADALGNTSVPVWNTVKNTFNEQTGAGEPKAWMVNASAVADEVARLMRSGQMSDAETKQWKDNLTPNMSPTQQRAAIGKLHELVNAAIEAQATKRANDLGERFAKVKGGYLSPEATAAFDRVHAWTSGGAGTGTALPTGVKSIKVIE